MSKNPYSYDGQLEPSQRTRSPPWVPDAGVTLHNGQPIPPTMVFPLAPPKQIGRILSAESVRPISPLKAIGRVVLSIVVLAAVYSIIPNTGIGLFFKVVAQVLLTVLIGCFVVYVGVNAMARILAGNFSSPPPHQTFVGEGGFASWQDDFESESNRRATITFNQLTKLVNGCFQSLDHAVVYWIQVLYSDNPAMYHFYRAIDDAWTRDVVQTWRTSLRETGSSELELSETDSLFVTSDSVMFKSAKLPAIEIRPADIENVIVVKHSLLSLQLRHELAAGAEGRFDYFLHQVPNASAVLILLPEILGVPLQQAQLIAETPSVLANT